MDDFIGTMLSAPLLLPLMVTIECTRFTSRPSWEPTWDWATSLPPVLPILFLAGRIGGGVSRRVLQAALKFMIFAQVPVIILTTYIPGLSMWLPRLIMGVQ